MREIVREKSDDQTAGGRSSGTARPLGTVMNLISENYFVPNGLNSKTCSLQTKIYFEAYEPISRFVVWLDDGMEFRLEMTYRTPTADPTHRVGIHYNGTEKRAFPASLGWTSVELDNIVFNAGRNDLAITWPMAQGATKARIEHSVGQLRRGILPNPLMEFGHCYRLRLVKPSRDLEHVHQSTP
jgi:hypothetical protein